MAVTLEQAKLALRIDSTAEDSVLDGYIASSTAYLRQAVNDYDANIAASTDYAKLADQAQMALITEMYENRGVGDGPRDYSYIVRSMINQLQFWPDTM